MDTPYYKGHVQVGLVPNVAAEALLGIDIINRKIDIINRNVINVVTRQQRKQELDEIAQGSIYSNGLPGKSWTGYGG